DINPVMAIYAKANLFKPEDVKLLLSLRDEIINQVLNSDYSFTKNPGDPLLTWFSPEATKHFRHIEFVLRKLLLSEIYDTNKNNFEEYPSLVCFFYVGIFQSLRALSNNFRSS